MKWKKIIAIGVGALMLGGTLVGCVNQNDINRQIEEAVIIAKAQGYDSGVTDGKNSVMCEDITSDNVEVIEIETAPLLKEIADLKAEIDNKQLALEDEINTNGIILDHIFDNDGKIEYLVDDLDDDEISEIVDRIVFINDAKVIAAEEVKDELADELDGEQDVEQEDGNITIVNFDEDDIRRIRVQDDADEIEIVDPDYEDRNVDVIVTAKFKHNGDDFEADFKVEVEESKVDDLEILEIREK